MSKQFEHMQKLAFGKILSKETLSEADLRNKIKELVHSTLGEAKKKKKEKDVAPQDETADLDLGMDAEMSTDDIPTDTMAPDTSAEIDIDPKVKAIQDSLSKALANAKALGDEKLVNQIGNTITMLVRTQVVGQQVAESLDEIEGDPDDYYGYNEPIDPKDYADEPSSTETDYQEGYRHGYNNGYKDALNGEEKEKF